MDDKNIGERFLLYVCKTGINRVRLQYAGTAGFHFIVFCSQRCFTVRIPYSNEGALAYINWTVHS